MVRRYRAQIHLALRQFCLTIPIFLPNTISTHCALLSFSSPPFPPSFFLYYYDVSNSISRKLCSIRVTAIRMHVTAGFSTNNHVAISIDWLSRRFDRMNLLVSFIRKDYSVAHYGEWIKTALSKRRSAYLDRPGYKLSADNYSRRPR